MTYRGTTNRNDRGSSYQRRVRKLWLLVEFGDGVQAPCSLRVSAKCEGTVTISTITVDRHPIPGAEGGRYTRDNIRPACAPCNQTDGGRLGVARKSAKPLKGN